MYVSSHPAFVIRSECPLIRKLINKGSTHIRRLRWWTIQCSNVHVGRGEEGRGVVDKTRSVQTTYKQYTSRWTEKGGSFLLLLSAFVTDTASFRINRIDQNPPSASHPSASHPSVYLPVIVFRITNDTFEY